VCLWTEVRWALHDDSVLWYVGLQYVAEVRRCRCSSSLYIATSRVTCCLVECWLSDRSSSQHQFGLTDPGNAVLGTLQLVKICRQCTTWECVAIVKPGRDGIARDFYGQRRRSEKDVRPCSIPGARRSNCRVQATRAGTWPAGCDADRGWAAERGKTTSDLSALSWVEVMSVLQEPELQQRVWRRVCKVLVACRRRTDGTGRRQIQLALKRCPCKKRPTHRDPRHAGRDRTESWWTRRAALSVRPQLRHAMPSHFVTYVDCNPLRKNRLSVKAAGIAVWNGCH